MKEEISQIRTQAEQEKQQYLEYHNLSDNPFTTNVTKQTYVPPNKADLADIITEINSYTGPIVIHSQYSGVGKTTLVKMLLKELSNNHSSCYIGEHNVTSYELVSIIADKIGVGKSSSTKLTENKLQKYQNNNEKPLLIAVDEFGLNDPNTLHSLQFINDEINCKLILTGMSNQWNSISKIGTEGKAFKRRVSVSVKLQPLDFTKVQQLVRNRIQTDISEFITSRALRTIAENSKYIPGVIVSSLAKSFNLAAYRYSNGNSPLITNKIANSIDYPDPYMN